MAEINQIEEITGGVVSDADLLVIYDSSVARTYSITRGELLRGVARNLPAMARGSVALTVPAVPPASTVNAAVTLEGAAIGSAVALSFDGGLPAGLVATAYVSNANTVTITFANVTAAANASVAKVARIAAWALS